MIQINICKQIQNALDFEIHGRHQFEDDAQIDPYFSVYEKYEAPNKDWVFDQLVRKALCNDEEYHQLIARGGGGKTFDELYNKHNVDLNRKLDVSYIKKEQRKLNLYIPLHIISIICKYSFANKINLIRSKIDYE